jgi:hypothetical protein
MGFAYMIDFVLIYINLFFRAGCFGWVALGSGGSNQRERDHYRAVEGGSDDTRLSRKYEQ